MKNKVKEIINKRGITVEELSSNTGIGRTTVYQIVNCKCITNVDYALRISKYLKMPIDELFFSDEE